MTHVEIDGDALVLTGEGTPPAAVRLVGPRARVTGTIATTSSGWSAHVPLVASRWGGPELPLPAGTYRLSIPVDAVVGATAGARVSIDGETVVIAPLMDEAYDSRDGQAALERRYTAQRGVTQENAVFFESFYGRNASCNPLAIDAELARRAPDVTRYWSVVDLSVAVPEGAVAVVEGSPQWWRARAAARLLVVNDWLRRRYVRRPGQRVLQTWHGTPLKRLALHRPGFDPRRALAVWRESRRWDALLAQNPYAADILRSAYAFGRRPMWVDGYPRNDALAVDDGSDTRARLGIGADERVLLYAPTWRDDRTEMVDFLDPVALAEATGAVVLVRGHSRTLLPGHDAEGARVIDVTGFPDTARLLAVADALITDYSSVMFDFSVTGRPMYFFVPDMDHYRGELRGFYFDLVAQAPGPLVTTQEELVTALNAGDDASYAELYAAWRQRFNARDDGRAAERVVSRLIDQRWIDVD